jgi:hypothetical protein
LCVLVLAAPLSSCTWVLDEGMPWPSSWNATPPDTITLRMNTNTVDERGRDWIDRCLDTGGAPVVLVDNGWCVNVDY